jgi:hypothetical protein
MKVLTAMGGGTGTECNLCQRKERTDGFASKIDEPHSSKSYYPLHQFVHAEALAEHPSKTELQKFVFGFVFAQMSKSAKGAGHEQMSTKAGIKKHGRRVEEALMAKFTQLEYLTVFEGIDLRTLTGEQPRTALLAINLIKEKRDGQLKGCMVTFGRPQR